MAQSAFIVRVPEAEPYVAHLRERFDPSARRGVPAHITLLYPFMSPELITGAVLEQVRSVASAAAFPFRLASVGRFPGTLYLVPEPAEPFVALTENLVRQFPMFPPYGGQHEAVVPHLTVAQADAAPQGAIEAELLAALRDRGAVTCTCRELVLIEDSSGVWKPLHAFALACAAGGSC